MFSAAPRRLPRAVALGLLGLALGLLVRGGQAIELVIDTTASLSITGPTSGTLAHRRCPLLLYFLWRAFPSARRRADDDYGRAVAWSANSSFLEAPGNHSVPKWFFQLVREGDWNSVFEFGRPSRLSCTAVGPAMSLSQT